MNTCKLFIVLLFLMFLTSIRAQHVDYNVERITINDDIYDKVRRIIRMPMVNGLLPLRCDFHNHTVYSDGFVWPAARVKEAWQNGLDAIAMTDHTYLAGQNPRGNLTNDPNTSYTVAQPEGEMYNLIVIQGTEISRPQPAGGHINALFIKDASKTVGLSAEEAVKEAVQQGAFIIWNHPPYPTYSTYTLSDTMYAVNKRLIDAGYIQAVEVFNEAEWYPRVLSWCRDYNLAPIAATDIHDLTTDFYGLSEKTIRPMTIVLAREKSQEAIKEALIKHHTIAFFNGMLAGNSELLKSFFFASVSIKRLKTVNERDYYVISNPYDVPYVLLLENGKKMTLHPNSEVIFYQPVGVKKMEVNIVNLHIYENETLKVTLQLP